MVFLRSVHSDPESIRLSFCGPDNPEDGAFALSVDELVGGPVVIRIAGSIDRSAIPVIGECVADAVRSAVKPARAEQVSNSCTGETPARSA
ncbi:hypothetical protein E4P29_06810 [Rhodococcus sp. 1R11]|uniref:hypothetical protein n=1 Tax=Rhodococcus sp. 1R11 TaxID=2559614 RepID=UPI00107289AC|nr:hypothetical protein [Rhodococcus sp. 1R11]TFI44473.1 hypothetical protein E4P29_06810 [Rhodococcus sp. 1R11]